MVNSSRERLVMPRCERLVVSEVVLPEFLCQDVDGERAGGPLITLQVRDGTSLGARIRVAAVRMREGQSG
jgi:hypothetical protein